MKMCMVMGRSNIHTVLRNIIDSGFMSTPASSTVTSKEMPPSTHQESSSPVKPSSFYYPSAPQRTTKIDLSHSTLDIANQSPYVDTTTVISDVMDNLDDSNRTLFQERTQTSVFPSYSAEFIDDQGCPTAP